MAGDTVADFRGGKSLSKACSLLLFALAGLAPAQTFSVLHTFQYFPHGASPAAPLYRDSLGNLYGTTEYGGAYNAGVVFKLDSTGSQTVLHTFTGGADGGNPTAGVTMDSAGNLYGTAFAGGYPGVGINSHGAGVIYKIEASGVYSVLYAFKDEGDGANPDSGVIVDAAGNLYGTTYWTGNIYKISPAGVETVLYTFTEGPSGIYPVAGVTADAAGNLYGTTSYGGALGFGAVYKLSSSGAFTVLHALSYSTSSGVILDAEGNLYGTESVGVYKLAPTGSFTLLARVYNGGGISGLARDSSSNFYFASSSGIASQPAELHGAVYKLSSGGALTALYGFSGSVLEVGNRPFNAAPILDAAGNLYGTTPNESTAGIIYEIAASGGVRWLYDFAPSPGGSEPASSLTYDSAGNLYGTTAEGGGSQNGGTVYKLSPAGKQTVLYAFQGGTTDGAGPTTGVVFDHAGNLYGTTPTGGVGSCVYDSDFTRSCGVVYKVSPSGQESILHFFSGGADGGQPNGLAIDSQGNLYGTASLGGLSEGVVFKVDTAGAFSVLYSFTGGSDGGEPLAGVTVDAAGNLYGTTYVLGGWGGSGVIFKIDAAGAYNVLHSFPAEYDSCGPQNSLTLDAEGNLYGTCTSGGSGGDGWIFKLTPAGELSTVFAFAYPSAVGHANSSVVLDGAGNLYGTISNDPYGFCPGTTNACGEVYRVSPSGKENVLYSFTGGADGASPVGVTLGADGALYGIATGLLPVIAAGGGGVAFRIALP